MVELSKSNSNSNSNGIRGQDPINISDTGTRCLVKQEPMKVGVSLSHLETSGDDCCFSQSLLRLHEMLHLGCGKVKAQSQVSPIICIFHNGRVALPKWMNFRKTSKKGGGGHFHSKNLCCDFGPLHSFFLTFSEKIAT